MKSDDRPAVLFFTPYGEWRVHNQLDVTVAAAVRARGFRIRYVSCDGLYQPCASTRDQQDCVRCQATMAEMLAGLGVEASLLQRWVAPEDVVRADTWLGEIEDEELATARFDELPVGDWALSTTMTHFRVSNIPQLNDPLIVPVHRRFVRDALLTYWAIDRILREEQFEALLLFNGRFYPYRAAFEAARRRSVRVLVHERGRRANSFSFYEDENCLGVETSRRLAASWSDVALGETEIKRLDRHFATLQEGRNANWPAFYTTIKQVDLRAVLDVPDNARLLGFFTSSPDEIAHLEQFGDVGRQFELIENVARAIRGTDVYLVVRHHPHIAGAANSIVEKASFHEAYTQALRAHENVRIVMPSDELASHALFPELVAAIAPFSTIAMELIASGIPTVVSKLSEVHLDKRFVLTDWSWAAAERTVAFLSGPQARLTRDDLRRFYRNCYSQLYRSSVEFEVIGYKDYFYAVSSFASAAELVAGRDPTLDSVCDHLFSGSAVYRLPGDEERSRSTAEEDEFIARQMDSFIQRRQAFEARSFQPRLRLESFAVIADETSAGHVSEKHWSLLPNSRQLSIHPLRVPPANWMTNLLLRLSPAGASDEFAGWCKQLNRLLAGTAEPYVLVTNRRFQFHDTSIAAISDALALAGAGSPTLIPLSGWLQEPDRFFPVRLQPVKVGLASWRDVRARLGGAFRPQDALASVVVRRDWLTQCLTGCLRARATATALEDALFEEASTLEGGVAVMQPVFLLR